MKKILSIILVCIIVTMISGCNKTNKSNASSIPTNNLISVKDSSRYINNIFEKVDTETNIPYTEVTNSKGEKENLLLDVYTPSGDKETSRLAIIWIHGGGYTSGSKDYGLQKDLAVDFAKKGYVTLSINYRLSKNLSAEGLSAIKNTMDDANAALKWLRSNSEKYGVDKNHIAIGGYSAGGGITGDLCYSDSSTYDIDKKGIFAAIDLSGDRQYFKSEYKDAPPCIIIQGTSDTTVPYSTSEALSSTLNKNGIYNKLYPIKGSNHDLTANYNEIVNEITKFLYKVLTGKDIHEISNQGNSSSDNKVSQRLASGKLYQAKQVDLKIDGKLDEWGNSQIINLDQLKDIGISLPDKDDFSGTAMVGWNEKDPTRIYIAAVITDDIIQDINGADKNWFNDDCLEIAFDLSRSNKVYPISKWVIGATGKDLSALANKENTECKIVKDGNKYTYEIAIDITKPESSVPDVNKTFKIKADNTIGFSPSYNECENNVREQQIGWIAGSANDRGSFGNLKFISEKAMP